MTDAEISVVGNAGLSASTGILRMKRPGTRYCLMTLPAKTLSWQWQMQEYEGTRSGGSASAERPTVDHLGSCLSLSVYSACCLCG